MDADRLSHLARLSEDALRAAALTADPADADELIDRAGERASQVEQLRAIERPQGTTATALEPAPHAVQWVEEAEAALAAGCRELIDNPDAGGPVRDLAAHILASCR